MRASLSGRLLALTIVTVMLIQVAIFAPSLSRFRADWLNDRLMMAQLASLAILATPEGMLDRALEEELLARAGVESIVLRRGGARALVLSQLIPQEIDETIDLRDQHWLDFFLDTVNTLLVDGDRNIRVIGRPYPDSSDEVEVTLRASPLKGDMAEYARRTLWLSIGLSAVVAGLVYLFAQRLFLRPVGRMIENMAAFRQDPEDIARVMRPTSRIREIAEAERALEGMETDIRDALRQRARLAALGQAVAKISHDLRNMLASAQLMAERFETSKDPLVRRVGPKLIASLGRAIALCEGTLRYGKAEEAEPEPRRIALAALVEEVGENVFPDDPAASGVSFENRTPEGLVIAADPDQMYRVLSNLCRNARQAMETTRRGGRVSVGARETADGFEIDVADDGPGLPEKARENLFKPFSGGARKGGAGLGLAIAHELTALQGGALSLITSTTRGTTFRISLPRATQRNGAPCAQSVSE